MSRDPDRIAEVLSELEAAWRANPDMRLTQLVFNAASYGYQFDGVQLPSVPTLFYNTEELTVLRGLSVMSDR